MAWNDDRQDQDGPKRKNPWGAEDNSDKPTPGNRPRGGGNNNRPGDDLDFDKILNNLGRKVDQLLSGGSGESHPFRIGAIVLLAATVIWLLSGIYFIQPNENGVVLTFGKYTRTDEMPGIKWKVPWPIQNVEIVDVTTERRIHVGYSSTEPDTGSKSAHQESLMLTGDENIVDINFVVLWKIHNAKDFLYSIRDPEDTINMVAASTMREIIGQTKIQPALTDARTKIQSDARALMQKLLDEYHSGITINNVQLQKVDPPAAVVDAFNEVQRARQKKEELKNIAEAYRNDIIPRAKGEAEKLRQDAEAYKQEVVSRATGDAKRFDNVYIAYQSAKDVTTERMYIETIESVLKNAKTIVSESQGNNLMPLIPLGDALKAPQAPAPSAAAASITDKADR